MTTYRMGSSSLVHAPGMAANMVVMARTGDEVLARKWAKCWDIPDDAVENLLQGKYTVEDETVLVEGG